jgi:tetratricopeptide (TPR) repeat protein
VTAARYRVKSYPSVLVLRKDGTEIDRVVGYYRAPEFMARVEDYLAGRNTLASLAAQEADSANSATFLSGLADRYFEHGLYEDARNRYLAVTRVDPKNTSSLTDDALYSLARMSRKDKDYAAARAYAQRILDDYKDADVYKSAILELAGNWRRDGKLTNARRIYLDYAKRYPKDEDAPWATEQADSCSARLKRGEGV